MIRSLLHPTRPVASAIAAVGLAVLLSACGSSLPSVTGSAVAAAQTRTVTATVTAGTTVSQEPSTVVSTLTVTSTAAASAPSTSAGDTSSSTTPTGLKVGGVGITATDRDGTAQIAVVTAQRKTVGTGDYSKPPKNGNYVIVDISYTCTSGKFVYNPFDWKIRDAQGRSFDSSFSNSGYGDPALHSGTLAKSSKARGFVVFDAPKGALTLEYESGYNSAPASWNLPA